MKETLADLEYGYTELSEENPNLETENDAKIMKIATQTTRWIESYMR